MSSAPAPVGSAAGHHPLSVSQEQLWYLHQLRPARPAYHEVLTVEHDGRLDPAVLAGALVAVIARHDAWHSTFHTDRATGEGYVRVDAPPEAVDLPVHDLSHLSPPDAERQAAALAAAASSLPYRLDVGPMIRPHLVRLPDQRDRLYLAMHHIIFDAASVYRTVLAELAEACAALGSGHPVAWEHPAASYGDFARWERDWIDGDRARQRLEWWAERLAGVEPLHLPLDRPRPPSPSWAGATVCWDLPATLVGELTALARAHRASLFHVLATALAAVLARYSGQDEVLFTVAADTRQRPAHRGVVGYCVTPVMVRAAVGDDPPFAGLLQRVRDQILGGLDHLVPFERVVRAVAPPRSGSFTPWFSVATVFEPPMTSPDPAWRVVAVEGDVSSAVGAAKTDLDLSMEMAADGGLRVRLVYDTDLWDGWRADAMCRHWSDVLAAAAADPSTLLSRLPLVGAAEQRLLAAANATDAPLPGAPLGELIRGALRSRPDADAVVSGTDRVSAGDLDRWADAVAAALVANGLTAGQVVALGVGRGAAVVAGILGVLRAGGAFLPLDVHQPAARLAQMVRDAGATIVLTGPGAPPSCLQLGVPVVELAARPGPGGGPPPVSVPVGAAAAAYVMFTSGSTGRPKGTVVTQHGLLNVAWFHRRALDVQPGDSVLGMAPLSADTSMLEVFLALVSGARLVIAADRIGADPPALRGLLRGEAVTAAFMVPTALRLLVDSGWSGQPGLVVAACGEALPADLAESLLDREVVVFNSYGPTEATIAATLDRVERGGGITIGRPIDNVRVAVVGRHGETQPIGVPGELVIAGAGVAGGYLGLPELTAERFVPDPGAGDGARAYRTGDRARWRPDGRIEYLGRSDEQVKLRGHRVEPGEVAQALRALPGVEDAAVVVRSDRGLDELVAYVTGSPPDAAAMRAALSRRLPAVMVPAVFVPIGRVPVTASGKLDRAALPAPEGAGKLPPTPMSAAEAELALVWGGVIGAPVGPDDDFFDLGGHSILAIRLLLEVERRWGTPLPVSAFWTGGTTVRQMARLLDSGPTIRQAPVCAAPIPSGGRPLFLLFPHAWGQLSARHFASALGADPVIATSVPTNGWRYDLGRTVEQLASQMVAEIRASQPEGPYALGGYSFAGVVAYEAAGQLIAAGAEVEWVGLIDSLAPAAARQRQARATASERLRRRVHGGMSHITTDVRQLLQGWSNDLRMMANRPVQPVFDWGGAVTLVNAYQPRGHAAPVTVLATAGPAGLAADLGWGAVHAGALEVVRVPGTHDTVLAEPAVAEVAKRTVAALRAARAPAR